MTRGLSKQEDEEDAERRLYLDKFSILKRKYKDFKMPEFSPYSGNIVTGKQIGRAHV